MASSSVVRFRLAAFEQPLDALPAFDKTAGQEDHDQHEDDAQGQVPALADEGVDDGDHQILEPVGQEGKPVVQDVAR